MSRSYSQTWLTVHGGRVVTFENSLCRKRSSKSGAAVSRGLLRVVAIGIGSLLGVSGAFAATGWTTWILPTSYQDTYSYAGIGTVRYNSGGITGSAADPLTSSNVYMTLSGEILSTSQNSYNWGAYGGGYTGTNATSAFTIAPSQSNSYLEVTSPSSTTLVAASGYGAEGTQGHTISFIDSNSQSLTVSNAVMSIFSLGRPGNLSQYVFSQPFVILSSNSSTSQSDVGLTSSTSSAGYVLSGYEGEGIIQFLGSYSSISWSVTTPEYYSGFNLGFTNVANPQAATQQTTYNIPTGLISVTPNIVSANNRVGSTGFNLLSNVAGGNFFNNRFDGGTLKIDSSISTGATFTITGNKGYIDQSGNTGTFSGAISNDGSSTGRLVILNSVGSVGSRSGRVILGTSNTYTGGTEVQAGATLQIASADALGSGQLDLVGSATESATLAVTSSTTISNNITVSGDPTFDIASGTTTTVTGVIADGVSAGDVVKIGDGTLVLTAANTYTGPTTISAGTMTLSASGSIAYSPTVINNAIFDVTAATGNVTLGGTYTQGNTGTLKMSMAPVSNQQVNVTSTASLAGTLYLAASTGTYSPGRYTLMTSTGLGGSTFSALSSNLASVTNYNYSLGYDANSVYLFLRSTPADTLASIQVMGADLNKVYNAQYGIAQLGLSYDCKLFDKRNLCLSTGVRTTHSRADGTTYDGVALIAAYRARLNVRVGAWIDQNESRKTNLNVAAGNRTPMFGAFAVWNQSPGTENGLEVKLSAAYGQKDLTLTRPVVGTSELGQGNSKLSTFVAEARVGYGLQLNTRTSASPFIGLRYTNQSNSGYAESNAGIFSPLTFAKTSQSGTSVIAGVNLSDKPEGPIGLDLSAGVEHFVNTNAGQLNASGLDGLSAVQMTPILSNNRAFASASLHYDLAKNKRLLFGLSHSKQFTNSESVNSATVRYVIGL